MRILVLDDDDERHGYFRRQFIGHDVTHAYTYSECMDALLNTPNFEVVFLDHDLNDNGYRSTAESRPDHAPKEPTIYSDLPEELDGCCVAEDVVRLLPVEKRPFQIIVHSWNHGGAAEMMAILRDGGFKNLVRWEFNPQVDLKLNELSTK